MGLDDAIYRQRATAAAKAAVFLWLLGGFIYNAYHGHLISLSSALLFFPGIFVAGLLALPVFLVDLYKERLLLRGRARYRTGQSRASDWLILALVTPWWGDKPGLAGRARHRCREVAERDGNVGSLTP